MALEDLTRAADLFRPMYDSTNTVDGWVSLEVSPLLAYDTATTLAAAKKLFARADRPNLLIKIPGTEQGLPAIEEAIFAGIPVNVTLLFSREHYLAAAEAFLRGIERRIEAGLNPNVGSVASVFSKPLGRCGQGQSAGKIAEPIGSCRCRTHLQGCANLAQLASLAAGLQPRCASAATAVGEHGNQDPLASDVLYIKGLAAPFTVNTMPEGTLKALAAHDQLGPLIPADGG